MKILKGNRLLEARAILHAGEVYLPVSAVDKTATSWREELVFYGSPLREKRICVTLLSPGSFRDSLPPWVEHLSSACRAAGAVVIWHDGGRFPACELVLVLETGAKQTGINYLGSAFRSRPLANRLTRNIKKGLKLAYLPDPMPFRRPQFNLKPGLINWLFTPALAVQWPDSHPEMAGWILASLMEFWGNGEPLDGGLFALAEPLLPGQTADAASPLDPSAEFIPAAKAGKPQTSEESALEAKPTPSHFGKPVKSGLLPILESRRNPVQPRSANLGSAAGMSRVQYPEFFKMLDEGKNRDIKKEPFR